MSSNQPPSGDRDTTMTKKVLIVRLRTAGYQVTLAYDAVMAQTVAATNKPDLVVLDISMPGGDGFEVAERLSHSMVAPFIFITASKKPGLRLRAMELGAVDYLEKPFEAEQLLAAVYAALGESEPVS